MYVLTILVFADMIFLINSIFTNKTDAQIVYIMEEKI